ncbi:MAG: hypothetical protein GEV03_17075 [Streptosporangiales bacterium]|nr:hypothetical protein [Streptosporangiales bacterium]
MRMTTRKLVATAAIGATAFAAAPAAVAFADGPGTRESASVVQQIQQQTWPVYQRGDEGEDIRAAQHLLRGYSLEPGASARYDVPTNGVFDGVTEQALLSFQGWRNVPQTGKLDGATWDNFSSELENRPIDGDHGNNAEHVTAVQVLLNKHGANIAEDGVFGTNTRNAVKSFQSDHGLEPDGDVGPLTFKALVATSA